jgi:hypothetical protein
MEGDRTTLLEGAASLAAAPLGLTPGDGHAEALFAALHGLYWLTANLSQRAPLLLAVDDLQWADAPSLRYLLFLVRRLAGMPIAVLATARVGEADTETGGLLERLRSEDSVVVLRPDSLSQNASAGLVRARMRGAASQALCDARHELTAGNPFLLNELLRELASSDRTLEDDAGAKYDAWLPMWSRAACYAGWRGCPRPLWRLRARWRSLGRGRAWRGWRGWRAGRSRRLCKPREPLPQLGSSYPRLAARRGAGSAGLRPDRNPGREGQRRDRLRTAIALGRRGSVDPATG